MIEEEFAALVMKTRKRLQSRNIDVEDLQEFLIHKFSSPNSRDANKMVEEILTAGNLREIFHKLSKYGLWNHHNYYLLNGIIKKFARKDDVLKDAMDQYRKALTGYALAWKIKDCLASTNYIHAVATSDSENVGDDLFKRLSVKCEGINVTDHTLKYVHDLWEELAVQFALPEAAMILHNIAEGCICITWLGHLCPSLPALSAPIACHMLLLMFWPTTFIV